MSRSTNNNGNNVGKKIRSIGCMGVSVLVHGAAIFCLAVAPQMGSQSQDNDQGSLGLDVEMIPIEAPAQLSKINAAPPAPKVKAVKDRPKESRKEKVIKKVEKAVKKAKSAKAKPQLAKTLPAKKVVEPTVVKTDFVEESPAVAVVPVAKEIAKDENLESQSEDLESLDPEISEEESTEPEEATAVAEASEVPEATETPEAVAPVPVEKVDASTEEEPVDDLESEVEAAESVTKATTTNPSEKLASKGSPGKGTTQRVQDLRQMPGNRAPNYPLEARKNKVQGSVGLVYDVTDSGRVNNVRVAKSSGNQSLDQEAVKAIQTYKFYPGQAGKTTHDVKFVLNGPSQKAPSLLRSRVARDTTTRR